MLKELSYRTFEDLTASVRGGSDMRAYDLEGFIDDQDLIKVALKINYELGLKINPTREKTVELIGGRVKLPRDFNVLNFAGRCGSPTVSYADSLIEDKVTGDLEELRRLARLMNARPYQGTQMFTSGENELTHNLGMTDLVIRLYDAADVPVPYTYRVKDWNTIAISVNLSAPEALTVRIIGASAKSHCSLQIDECGTKATVCATQGTRRTEFASIVPIHMVGPTTPAYTTSLGDGYTGILKDGYFELRGAGNATVYLNYQSLMETDEGELLVYDNPLINEYYEYACKQRIFENLLLSGEPVDKQLQLIESRIRRVAQIAVSLARTPDFAELKKARDLVRKAMYKKYFTPFLN